MHEHRSDPFAEDGRNPPGVPLSPAVAAAARMMRLAAERAGVSVGSE